MVENIYEDADEYVCITHKKLLPCNDGEYHLVSNWPSDVAKIIDNNEPSHYTYN